MIASAPVTVATAAVVVAGFSQFCLLSMITGIREEKCQDWQEIIVSLTMLIGNNHFIDPQLRTKMSAKTTTDENLRDGFQLNSVFFKKDQQKSYSPNVGLEPTTLRLRVSCSTDWASRALILHSIIYEYKPLSCCIKSPGTRVRFLARVDWRCKPP